MQYNLCHSVSCATNCAILRGTMLHENRKSGQSLYLPPSVKICKFNELQQLVWNILGVLLQVGFTVVVILPLLLPHSASTVLLTFPSMRWVGFRFLAKFGKVPLFLFFYTKPIFPFFSFVFSLHSTNLLSLSIITARLVEDLLN